MKFIIEKLLDQKSLTQEEAREVMVKIMSGKFNDAQISGFLIALRAKGEQSEEIAGFAQAMREKMTSITISSDAIDMCGTGGDSSGTFNISTAASFVVAGSGVKVAKHGNRSMTSRSGSADVLEALGVDITLPREKVAECIETIGLGFMYAPSLHPAMKHAIGARKSLAVRTVFNILGPLCNPAGVKRQVLGVFDGKFTDQMAEVLKLLGAEHVMIVHGNDGLDEISTTDATKYTELTPDGDIHLGMISPSDFGFPTSSPESLLGGEPVDNAEIIQNIIDGKRGSHRDIVVINAAAGIKVGGKAKSLIDGIKLAEESIDSGSAKKVLESLVSVK